MAAAKGICQSMAAAKDSQGSGSSWTTGDPTIFALKPPTANCHATSVGNGCCLGAPPGRGADPSGLLCRRAHAGNVKKLRFSLLKRLKMPSETSVGEPTAESD